MPRVRTDAAATAATPQLPKTMSIRRYLGWIMLSALLPMVLFAAALLYFLWNTQQSHRNDEQLGRVRAMASVIEGELRSTVARLEILASDPLLSEGNLAEFHARSQRLLARSEDWSAVVLLGPDRLILNTAVPYGKALPPMGDMPYIREAFSTGKPTISDLIVARVLQVRTVAVAVPVVREGQVAYVLVAALNLTRLNGTLARLVPDAGVASVFDRNFNFIARARDLDLYIGQLPNTRLLQALQRQREGVIRSTTKDGIDTFTAFTRLNNGWMIGVGTPSADADRALALYLGVLVGLWLAVLLAGVALARMLLRRIDRSVAGTVEAANALASGHAVAFPPPAVQELAAFSNAVSSLFLRERQARAEEEAANRTKDEFLAMLGHELRNPLAPITTALHLMRLRGGDTFAKERGIIERQVQHMVRLIDDLLDVARITRGTVELRRAPVELHSVAAKAVETAAPLLEQRRVQLSVELPATGLQVHGDAVRLGQVVSNLVTNAAKFTPPGGQVALRGRVLGDTVELTVSDNGIGLEPDELARVFELFSQGRQSVDRPHGGLGLGLAIARSLATLHGGTLTAESAGRDQGSTFRLVLPRLQAPPVPPVRTDDGQAPVVFTGQGPVLVVDDNTDAALLLKDLLDGNGFAATVAHDGPQALALLRTARFETAVLDIGLPGMDGYELAEQIRRDPRCAGMRLIALTGYGQAADRTRTRIAGFDAHLVKPVDVRLLAEAMAPGAARATAASPAPGT